MLSQSNAAGLRHTRRSSSNSRPSLLGSSSSSNSNIRQPCRRGLFPAAAPSQDGTAGLLSSCSSRCLQADVGLRPRDAGQGSPAQQHHQIVLPAAVAVPFHHQQQQHQRRQCVIAAAASAAAAAHEPSRGSGSSSAQQQEASLAQPHQQQQQQDQQQLQQQQQQQPGLDLPPLELPPSRSAALWLHDMSDAQLQQAAADWGYQTVGRPLPEGVSLEALAETLPDQVFTLDLGKALGYLGLSLGIMALGYSYLWFWHSICPLWQQVLAWVVVGTGYYGVFQSAVDCAHFAFWPERPVFQDVLGAVLMAPSLFSYELFRLRYLNHIMCTNQLYEDLDGWHPLLPADLAAMPGWRATLTALLMATPLKFFASIGQWAKTLEGFDLKLHPKQTRFWVWLSWALPLGFVGLVWPALVAAGGVGSLVTYWLGPWMVFHCWLSVMSLVQHTGPHITWAEEGLTYDKAQAAINGTVSVQLPNWLAVLLHHSNHHLPTHLSLSIPSYNLPAAHEYLQQRLGPYLTTATLNANLLRNLMTAWLVYDEQQQRYLSFDEAEGLVAAAKQEQQEHEQQQQQQQQQQQEAAAAALNVQAAGSASEAAAAAGQQRRAPVITASIPIEKLLGVEKARANGSSGGGSGSQQQQLAGSGTSSAAGAAGL